MLDDVSRNRGLNMKPNLMDLWYDILLKNYYRIISKTFLSLELIFFSNRPTRTLFNSNTGDIVMTAVGLDLSVGSKGFFLVPPPILFEILSGKHLHSELHKSFYV